LELFKRPIAVNIINFESKTIVKRMPNFCLNMYFDLHESPWSPDENRFVYSIISERNFVEEGK
jgi:hypothetical protein